MQVVTALLTQAAVFAQLEVHGDEADTKMVLFFSRLCLHSTTSVHIGTNFMRLSTFLF